MELVAAMERIELLEQRVETLENRLNALSSPANEGNIRATIANVLRVIANDVDDEIDLVAPPRRDPNEDDED